MLEQQNQNTAQEQKLDRLAELGQTALREGKRTKSVNHHRDQIQSEIIVHHRDPEKRLWTLAAYRSKHYACCWCLVDVLHPYFAAITKCQSSLLTSCLLLPLQLRRMCI